MAEVTFTFNGISSSAMGVDLLNVTRDLVMPVEVKTLDIPGRDGSYFVGTTRKSREVTLTIGVKDTSMEALRDKVRAIAAWLITPIPASLIISDEPDKEVKAILNGDTLIEQLLTYGKVQIKFVQPDPYVYAVDEDVTELENGANVIANGGTVPVQPSFTLPITQAASYIKITAPSGKFVQIGQSDSVETAPTPRTVVELNDACDTTTGWATGTHADDGVVSGLMIAENGAFSPLNTGGSFGTGAAWHGPTLRKALPNPLNDFAFEMTVENLNDIDPWAQRTSEAYTLTGTTGSKLAYKNVNGTVVTGVVVKNASGTVKYSATKDFQVYLSGADSYIKRRSGSTITSGQSVRVTYKYLVGKIGRIEAYLLDINGVTLAKIGIADNSATTIKNETYGYVKTEKLWHGSPVSPALYNEFLGSIRMARKGSYWYFYSGKMPYSAAEAATLAASRKHARSRPDRSIVKRSWKDVAGVAAAQVAMVEIHIATYGLNGALKKSLVKSIMVQKLNNVGPEAVGTIADDGDVIQINCARALVMKNNQPFMEHVDFASEWFSLDPGNSDVKIETDGDFDTLDGVATVKKRWL